MAERVQVRNSKTRDYMIVTEGQSFAFGTLVLDNHRFVRCRFLKVQFLYSGGPWDFENCEIADCRFDFQVAALHTRHLLNWLRKQGLEGRRERIARKKSPKSSPRPLGNG